MLKSKDIMLRTHVSDLKGKISEQVRVEGFVQARRDQGGIKFLVVRDVTGTVQAIVTRQNGEVFDEVAKLTLESVIDLTGMIKEQKQAPGGFEIEIEALKVLSVAEPLPIPVVEEKSGGEVDAALRFDYRWLDLRKPEKLKIFKGSQYGEIEAYGGGHKKPAPFFIRRRLKPFPEIFILEEAGDTGKRFKVRAGRILGR